MTAKEFFKKWLFILFPFKKRIKQEEGVIGFYDSRPFDHFRNSLIYANETLILKNDAVEIYSRIYKDTTFVNVLVYDEVGLKVEDYKFDKIKPMLRDREYFDAKTRENVLFKDTKNNIVLLLFIHNNEITKELAKKFHDSSKYNFEQALVYNPRRVQMDFFKPVPKFYKLYDIFCEDLYFDLGFIDDIGE